MCIGAVPDRKNQIFFAKFRRIISISPSQGIEVCVPVIEIFPLRALQEIHSKIGQRGDQRFIG